MKWGNEEAGPQGKSAVGTHGEEQQKAQGRIWKLWQEEGRRGRERERMREKERRKRNYLAISAWSWLTGVSFELSFYCLCHLVP